MKFKPFLVLSCNFTYVSLENAGIFRNKVADSGIVLISIYCSLFPNFWPEPCYQVSESVNVVVITYII